MIITGTTAPPLLRTSADTAPVLAPIATARPSHIPAGLSVEIISSSEGLSAIGSDWDALYRATGRPEQVFQSWGFAQLWARTYLHDHASGDHHGTACTCRLAIATVRQAGRLILVWPLITQRQAGLKVLTWMGAPVAQYGDVLVAAEMDPLPLLRAAWTHLVEVVKPDLIRLRKVRADAATTTFLQEMGARASEHVEAPCVTLQAGGSSFEDRQSGKAKKNRRRLMRRLEEQGRVEFVASTEPAIAGAIADAGLTLKRDWLVRRGLLSPALADRKLDTFLRAATSTDATATGCRTFALTLDGRPIAVALGFVAQGRLMLHLITQAADAERFGAGVLNLESILRWAEAEGLDALDLLPPKADYKLDWADVSAPVADYALGVTLAGKAWARAFDGFARPRLKQATEALPLGLRQRMSARALREPA